MDVSWPEQFQGDPVCGRPLFTSSTEDLLTTSSSSVASFARSSQGSISQGEQAKKRAGYNAAKTRLTSLLVALKIPYEIFGAAPCPSSQQEVMHMIAPAAPDKLLLLYEYSFGFPAPRSLCVHSKWNLALGHIGLRRSLDAHDALLLPSLPDLQYISSCLRDIRGHRKNESELDQLPHSLSWETIRHCGREDGAQIHLYRFIPFGFSYHKLPDTPPPAPIFRYNAMTKQYQQHAYPYTTLPAIQSHLSPFMVIANGFDKYRRWLLTPEKLPDGPNFLARATNQGLLDDSDTKACFEAMLEIFETLELLDLARRQNSRWHPPSAYGLHTEPNTSSSSDNDSMFSFAHPDPNQQGFYGQPEEPMEPVQDESLPPDTISSSGTHRLSSKKVTSIFRRNLVPKSTTKSIKLSLRRFKLHLEAKRGRGGHE